MAQNTIKGMDIRNKSHNFEKKLQLLVYIVTVTVKSAR